MTAGPAPLHTLPDQAQAVLRQLARVRRRRNGYALQRAVLLAVAATAGTGAVLVLLALRARALVFAVGAWSAAAALPIALVLAARSARRLWLGRRRAARWVDTEAGLADRLTTLRDLEAPSGAPGAVPSGALERSSGRLWALLVRQAVDGLPTWTPRLLVPHAVPWAALGTATMACAALALVLLLAPRLRPPPELVVGNIHFNWKPGGDASDDARQLLVAPGTEHAEPETADGSDVAGEPAPDALAGLPAALQQWLRDKLTDDAWEHGNDIPPGQRQAKTRTGSDPSRQRPAGGVGGSEGPKVADAPQVRPTRPTSGGQPGAGNAGPGAGTDTDPSLYGEAHDGSGEFDRFELAIAARVRTRRGAAMDAWTTTPEADQDRHPSLAHEARGEAPAHRMPVPPDYAPIVRRLFAHTALTSTPSGSTP